ncbi:MAG: cytochrome c peroxidase [Pirellulaceae bacterium]
MLRVLMISAFVLGLSAMTCSGEDSSRSDLRRPTALAFSGDQRRLYVANRNGSIATIEWANRRLVRELQLGRRFSDIVTLRNGRVLVADEEAGCLLLLADRIDGLDEIGSVKVAPYPVFLCIGESEGGGEEDSMTIYVSCLWPRRVLEVHYADNVLSIGRTVDLPFSPRNSVCYKDKLIVADGFGNQLAIIDRASFRLDHAREFPGHNLRGMLVTPKTNRLVVAHQMLNELAHSVRNDVHWGLLMSNDLRWLEADAIIRTDSDLYKHGHMHPLGDAGDATADPSGLALTNTGRVVVTLGGVGEVAIGVEEDFSLRRVKVGRRPTDVIVAPDDRHVIVANTFDDSVSVVDTQELIETDRISLGKMRELTMREQGEVLFYDASLSHDRWMSCHSCHPDGHTNGLRNDNLSDKSYGAPKRVLSLLGNRNTAPFAWSGKTLSLDDQIRNSIKLTMQSDLDPTDVQVEALRIHLWSFVPPPPIDEMRENRVPDLVERGKAIFTSRGCVACHVTPRFTSPESYDVGMVDEKGNREFNPPSLRGVSQRRPFFHDNRASTLEDVFLKHRHQLDEALDDEERVALLAFLRSL